MIEIFFVFSLIASAITSNKLLLNYFPPIFFVGTRMLVAGIILLIISKTRKNNITLNSIKQNFIALSIITICTTFLPALFKSYALKYMPSYKATFFGSLDPFITAIYAYLLWSEKLSFKKVIGIIFGIMGTLIMILNNSEAGIFSSFLNISLPEIAAFLAIAIGRYGWILVQSMLKKHIYLPREINAITMTGSGVISLITSFFLENNQLTFIKSLPENVPVFLGLMSYTIIIGNVISLTLYAHLLKKYQSTTISLAGFSIPLFVQLFGFIYLSEPISYTFMISLALTFSGFLIFSSEKI